MSEVISNLWHSIGKMSNIVSKGSPLEFISETANLVHSIRGWDVPEAIYSSETDLELSDQDSFWTFSDSDIE